MALDLNDPNQLLPTLVVLFEIILFLLLNLAVYNIRRLNLKNKLIIVYSIVPINLLVAFFYMREKGSWVIDGIFDGSFDFGQFWYFAVHGIFGFITMSLATFLLLILLPNVVKSEIIPLSLIRKLRPIMFTTYICWTITVSFGVMIYIHFYLDGFPLLELTF